MVFLLTPVWLFLIALLGATARFWARYRGVCGAGIAAFLILVFVPPVVALLVSAANDKQRHAVDHKAALLALQSAVDAFPVKWCKEPAASEPSPTTSLRNFADETLGKDLFDRLAAAGASPVVRWPLVYSMKDQQWPGCPPTPRPARDAATPSPTPTASGAVTLSPGASASSTVPPSPTTSPSTTPVPSPSAAVSTAETPPPPDSAVTGVWTALRTYETAADVPFDAEVRSAAARWDHGLSIPGWGLTSGGWPAWLLVAVVVILTGRAVWVRVKLYGGAPITVSALEADSATDAAKATAKGAREAVVAGVGEIGLLRPTAAPTSAGDDLLETLEAVEVIPAAGPFIKAVTGVIRVIRRQPSYSVSLVHNPASGGPEDDKSVALVVEVTDAPVGDSVLFRSVSGKDAATVGRSAAFDIGCAVLTRSRNVPRWAEWPPGTGEALDLYLQAMRERRPETAATADPKTLKPDREGRQKLLQRAARVAPGNGLIRHELAQLEFQTSNLVQAAALLARNIRDYPGFADSRYRFAVTLAMISRDPVKMWFNNDVPLRQGVCDVMDPLADDDRNHLLALRPTVLDVNWTMTWLLETAICQLGLVHHAAWLSGWSTLDHRLPAVLPQRWRVARSALRTAEAVLAAVTAAQGGALPASGGESPRAQAGAPAVQVPHQVYTAAKPLLDAATLHEPVWQVSYNQACGLARIYGIGLNHGWNAGADRDPAVDDYARKAVKLLERAVSNSSFALARWSDDAVDLIDRQDPDLQPIRKHPAYLSLIATLDSSNNTPSAGKDST
jgi:hypothetical protein